MDNTSNTLGRTIESVLQRANENAGSFGPFLTAIYDAVALIDQSVKRKTIVKNAPALVAAAKGIATLADTLRSNSYNELRWTLTNISINYLMLVVEGLERAHKVDEAKALFEGVTYEYAKRLTNWDEDFVPSSRILKEFSWQTHVGPQLTCDRESARKRITEYHEARQKRVKKIERNLEHSEFLRREMQQLIASCERMFEWDMGDEIVRLRAETPYAIRTAKSWVLAAQKFAEGIDRQDVSDANIAKSARVISAHHLAEAQVKCALASAYVEYWKTGSGYRNFEVLGTNALAWAETMEEGNWDYFAPLVFCRMHEKLDEETEKEVRHMSRCADTALAYAMCLDAQMRVLPLRQQPEKFNQVRVAKDEVEVKPAEFPTVGEWAEKTLKSQKDIRDWHVPNTGDDKREDAWLGRGKKRNYPKQRLIGFDSLRGGSSHKSKSRKQRDRAIA